MSEALDQPACLRAKHMLGHSPNSMYHVTKQEGMVPTKDQLVLASDIEAVLTGQFSSMCGGWGSTHWYNSIDNVYLNWFIVKSNVL